MGLQSSSMHAHTSQNRLWQVSIIMSASITTQLGRSSHHTDKKQVKEALPPHRELKPWALTATQKFTAGTSNI